MHNFFKTSLISVSLICLALLTACGQPDAHDAFDQPIYLKDMGGKWIILNYWADWCKPCRQEIPSLNQLSKKYKHKVAVLGINFDQLPKDKLQKFIKSNDIHYTMLTDNLGKRFGIRNISTLPATFIISPNGVIVKELYGEQNMDDLVALMDIG